MGDSAANDADQTHSEELGNDLWVYRCLNSLGSTEMMSRKYAVGSLFTTWTRGGWLEHPLFRAGYGRCETHQDISRPTDLQRTNTGQMQRRPIDTGVQVVHRRYVRKHGKNAAPNRVLHSRA